MMDSEYSRHRTSANRDLAFFAIRNTSAVTGAMPSRSDGVLDLVVAPLDREGVGEVGRERLHAEPLGRVVAGRDQVDAELLARSRGSAPPARR